MKQNLIIRLIYKYISQLLLKHKLFLALQQILSKMVTEMLSSLLHYSLIK